MRGARGARRELRAEFAGGEVVEGAEAVGELGVGQAALAVELAEMIRGGAFAFHCVALRTTTDKIAVGIWPRLRLWHHVIQALHAPVDLPQAIETVATVARVNGPAQLAQVEKIYLFEARGRRLRGVPGFGSLARIRPDGRNLFGQIHFHQMARLAALQYAQGSAVAKPPQGRPHRISAKADALGEPGDGEAELVLPFETAVAQQVGVHCAVDKA